MKESPLEILERVYKSHKSREQEFREKFLNVDNDHYLMIQKSRNITYAWYELFINKNLNETKDNLWLAGKCAIERAKISKMITNRLFEVSRTLLSIVALSDNPVLIKEYTGFDYEMKFVSHGKERKMLYSDWVLKGENDVYHDVMLGLMGKDMDRVSRDLEIMKTVTLKKKMNDWMIKDYNLFKAIYEQDLQTTTNLLEDFVSKKLHKSRNRHEIYPGLLSFPALGYAKLAWINGLEVKIDSSFIPNELLSVKPIDSYTDFKKLLPTQK